jgi:protein kinase C substrate 80K-H
MGTFVMQVFTIIVSSCARAHYSSLTDDITTLLHHISVKFTCPQQPNLALPVSRIHDGICDCCDGADEPASGKCPNICDQVLKEERERQRHLQQQFDVGSKRRNEELMHYQEMLVKTEEEMEQVSNEYNVVESEMKALQEEINQLKHGQLKQRLMAMKETILSLSHTSSNDKEEAPLKGLLEPLSEEGLVTVIVQACQLAGEQEHSRWDASTCVPLRLAGLDVGIVWGNEDYKEGTVTEERLDLSTTTWQDLIDLNAAGETVWSVVALQKSSSRKRRLMDEEDYPHEYTDDDMAYDEHWEEDEEEEGDAPDMYDNDEESYYNHNGNESVDVNEINQELLDQVKANAFSAARLSFLNRASHLISQIDDLMKDTDDEEETEEKDDATKNIRSHVDPMAIQNVRNTLQQRVDSIQRGLKYAVSAEILVKPLESSHPDLVALAAGTLYHGKIRSSDLWQILAYMTVEFPTHACFSPWSILCPPEQSEQNGTLFPPEPIVKAVEQFCAEAHTDSSIICDTNGDEEIPTSIHDHYYGYSVIEPREANDVLSQAFARLDNLGDRSSIIKLEEQLDELKSKQDSLSSQMRDLEDEMGGRDHSKYGTDGELYSLRDSCHSVQEGKYDYEVCIFGRAQQKDHGQKSGTSLGNWKGIRIDEETGVRTLEWTNGAKCWNGPHRSATVSVTCGADNKILSAEEPDTCRYVLEMESYIACDDDHKQRHGL